jgi:NAD(P)-dependent dehydrogenase (short-subunit alcohol dehydrogenase family)
VHNAAYTRWTDVTEMTVDEAVRTMRVAYDGMVYGIKRLLPHMLATGGGSIVNIGSITGTIYVGGASAAYSAAKAAVEAYTRTLQVEMRHVPIHVTLVRLGTVAGTDFFGKHVDYRRMPRLLDFLPYLTVTQVADGVIKAIVERKEVVTMPGYLRPLSLVYTVAPRFSRWLARRGGSGQRDYANLG